VSDTQQALIDYLAKPENLPTALEISDHIEKVKDKLQYGFWAAVQTELDVRLVESGFNQSWMLRTAEQRPVDDYYWCCFHQIGRYEANEPCLCIQFMQAHRRDSYRLYYGIRWNREITGDFGLIEVQKLGKDLALAGFTYSPPWFVGKKFLDCYPRHNEFLIAMAQHGQELVLEFTQLFWTFFEEMRNRVMQINAVLAS
jgi:hypothetical protein